MRVSEPAESTALICSPNAEEPDPSPDECVVPSTGPEKDRWALAKMIEALALRTPVHS